jgi:hypothetical protein
MSALGRMVGAVLLVGFVSGCDLTAAGSPPATTYLMAPPPRARAPRPLREWSQVGTYESVRACNDAWSHAEARAKAAMDKFRSEDVGGTWWEADYSFWMQAVASLCVASNDPRLGR